MHIHNVSLVIYSLPVCSAISLAALLFAVVVSVPVFSERMVRTLAGRQADSGPPLNASLDSPAGVAADSSGNLQILDTKRF